MVPFIPGQVGRASGLLQNILPQDVFASTPYAGTGAAQSITNGIDLAAKGGLCWFKSRNSATYFHNLIDTARGPQISLASNTADAEFSATNRLTSFNSNGFSLGPDPGNNINVNGNTFASWTFRRSFKFFDIVTYMGDGTAGRQIVHGLGIAPGMIIVRNRSGGSWWVYHRSTGATKALALEQTVMADTYGFWNNTEPSANVFTVNNSSGVNAGGTQYVAYLFAHDPDPLNGIVQCGSFTADSTGNASVNLGWTPQFLLVKAASRDSAWFMVDSSRGWATGNDVYLTSNGADAESSGIDVGNPTSTGFTAAPSITFANATYVYLAIRAPIFQGLVRPQDAFATNLFQGNGGSPLTVVSGLNLPRDGGMLWTKIRSTTSNHVINDTARGAGNNIYPNLTNAEYGSNDSQSCVFNTDGYTLGINSLNSAAAGQNFVGWSFRRAAKFFDIVTYTGDGVSGRQIPHGLGINPGMVIVKRRDMTSYWSVWHRSTGSGAPLILNGTNTSGSTGTFENGYINDVSATMFNVVSSNQASSGNKDAVNASGGTYVAYIFAHDPDLINGIIQCGVTSCNSSGVWPQVNLGWQPQFMIVKNSTTSSYSHWTMWDAARGGRYLLNPNLTNAETDYGVGSNVNGINASGFKLTDGYYSVSTTAIYMAIRATTT